MEKVILIRFGEIYLKGKNRKYFEKTLENNIKNAIKGFDCTVSRIPGRYEISGFDPKFSNKILSKIGKISGIYSYSPDNLSFIPNKYKTCPTVYPSGIVNLWYITSPFISLFITSTIDIPALNLYSPAFILLSTLWYFNKARKSKSLLITLLI